MIKTVRSGGYLFTPTVDAVTLPAKRLIMKLLGFLNLKGISAQIAALVGRLDHRKSPDPHRSFLFHRPDQYDRRSTGKQSARSGSPASRHGARGPEAAAFRRHRGGHFRTGHRKPSAGFGCRGGRTGWPQDCVVCIAASGATTGSFRSRRGKIPTRSVSPAGTARLIPQSSCPDERQRPFWIDRGFGEAVCRHQRSHCLACGRRAP